jgi:16S rRNA C967 or C1407 C5-methylase (RsmB/RsmF family)
MSRGEWQDQDLLAVAKDTPLSKLAENLGLDVDTWLAYATEPLPETFRITPNRYDRAWTETTLRSIGGAPLPWAQDDFAWQMPFARGQAPDSHAKHIMALLHESGRITRQEAASMIPVLVLQPQSGELVLDMCAAPGSKATQIAEAIHPNGVVVANEPASGRVNMLVSNRGRLAISNMLINQQDGRHLGRIPPPGYDGIVADVPCTGSATSRKNRNVWWKWTPRDGRSLFNLQVEIAYRGATLLRPGHDLVYSTCSLDPCENEAVVAELLRRAPWLELVPIDRTPLKNLIVHEGLQTWDVLDETGAPYSQTDAHMAPGIKPPHLSPSHRLHLAGALAIETDEALEQGIEAVLPHCIRLYHQDNNTGGFFVAKLRHKPEATPENVARTFVPKRYQNPDSGWVPKMLDVPPPNRHSIFPAPQEIVDEVQDRYGLNDATWSWWHRGKRLNIAPKLVEERIFNRQCPNKRGNLIPEGTFHPLKLIHVGLPAFTQKRKIWRSRQESVPALRALITAPTHALHIEALRRMLTGWAPLMDDYVAMYGAFDEHGPVLMSCMLPCGEALVSGWVGARLTLMIDRVGRDVLRMKLGMSSEAEEEE